MNRIEELLHMTIVFVVSPVRLEGQRLQEQVPVTWHDAKCRILFSFFSLIDQPI